MTTQPVAPEPEPQDPHLISEASFPFNPLEPPPTFGGKMGKK